MPQGTPLTGGGATNDGCSASSCGAEGWKAGTTAGCNGNCVVIEDAATGAWSDTPCDLLTQAIGYLCEIEPR